MVVRGRDGHLHVDGRDMGDCLPRLTSGRITFRMDHCQGRLCALVGQSAPVVLVCDPNVFSGRVFFPSVVVSSEEPSKASS